MKKTVLTILVMFAVSVVLFAQGDVKTRMNSIKKSSAYIYGEATLATSEDAVSAARENLLYSLKNFIKDNGEGLEIKDVNPEDLVNACEILSTPRGSMIRALGFVHKSAFSNYVEIEEESFAGSESAKQGDAAGQSAAAGTKERFESKLVQIGDLFVLYSVLDSDEWSSAVKYGKVKTNTDPVMLAESYLVVFSQDDYVIKACMSPKDGTRTNLATGKPDSTRQYPNCQAVWVKLAD